MSASVSKTPYGKEGRYWFYSVAGHGLCDMMGAPLGELTYIAEVDVSEQAIAAAFAASEPMADALLHFLNYVQCCRECGLSGSSLEGWSTQIYIAKKALTSFEEGSK